MEIYLIRHTSVSVPKGVCYGSTDVELSDTFEEEAIKTKKQIEGLKFDAVFSSPMTRTLRLASYCGYPDAKKDSRLVEFDFGLWEMKRYDELYKEDSLFREWCENYIMVRCPGGERLIDQVERVKSFIMDVKKREYKRICCFCHGGILAIGRSIGEGISLEETFKDIPPYGSVIRIEV